MSDDGMRELHVTAFDVEAGVRHGWLGDNGGLGVPLVALEIEGRPSPDAGDVSLWLRLPVDVARAGGRTHPGCATLNSWRAGTIAPDRRVWSASTVPERRLAAAGPDPDLGAGSFRAVAQCPAADIVW